MFHDGDLNSGISLAIQQQKLVACFIRQDDDVDSELWETEWLSDMSELIDQKAVLLRMEYASKEAGFLGAFCQIEKAPTLVVIRNGQVLEKLERGIEHDDFVERLWRVMGFEEADDEEEPAAVENTIAAQPDQPTTTRTPAATSLPTHSSQQDMNSLFPDRAQKVEAEKVKREAAENAARQARQDARRKEAEDAYAAHRGDKGKQKTTSEDAAKQQAREQWIYQQKKRKDEAKKDKERILAQIEADKKERRLRAEQAKAKAGDGFSMPLPDDRVAASRRTAGAGGRCALLIRLFDGSSIRGRFPTDMTLAKGVREWVREQAPEGSGGADIPYSFRQILAPQPSRGIEVSEEHQTLADLDLVPNATLVLVPVAGYTDAYAGSSSGVFGYISSAYNSLPSVSNYLPSLSRIYLGGTADPQEPSNVQGAKMAGASVEGSTVKVKTLADQRAEAAEKDPQEFYNGNSLRFEERKDDGVGEPGES